MKLTGWEADRAERLMLERGKNVVVLKCGCIVQRGPDGPRGIHCAAHRPVSDPG